MFHNLDPDNPEDALIARGLKVLRERIEVENIPPSKLDETLNVATWNIREFGKVPRSKAAIHYIAEIMSQFDVIAVTELRAELGDLERVLDLLGPYWKVVFNDFGMDRAGNRERMAFVYDKRMAVFTGMAAEADEPRKKDQETGEYLPQYTWWRAPYMASFRAGNFDFTLLAAHIRWGDDEEHRLSGIEGLAAWVAKRAKDRAVFDKDIILLGDFNIPDLEGPLYRAFADRGWTLPAGIVRASRGTNLSQRNRYDQILYNSRYTKLGDPIGGDLDFYRGDFSPLFPEGLVEETSRTKLTYQLSDHLPLWIQIDTWNDDEVLDQIIDQSVEPG